MNQVDHLLHRRSEAFGCDARAVSGEGGPVDSEREAVQDLNRKHRPDAPGAPVFTISLSIASMYINLSLLEMALESVLWRGLLAYSPLCDRLQVDVPQETHDIRGLRKRKAAADAQRLQDCAGHAESRDLGDASQEPRGTSNCKINGHFSIENHRFSGTVLHSV